MFFLSASVKPPIFFSFQSLVVETIVQAGYADAETPRNVSIIDSGPSQVLLDFLIGKLDLSSTL